METTLREKTLTDGSKVFSVVFVDGSNIAELHCIDYIGAIQLQNLVAGIVSFGTIES